MTVALDHASIGLAEFVSSSKAPLGTLSVAGRDLAAMIEAESDVATLRAAAARAAGVGDRRWQIALARRLTELSRDEDVAAELCGWLIEVEQTSAARQILATLDTGTPVGSARARRLSTRLALAAGDFENVADSVQDEPLEIERALDAGWGLLGGGSWSHLPPLLDRLRQEAPDHPAVAALDLRMRCVFDGPVSALAALAERGMPIRRGGALHAELTARFLGETGRFAEALDVATAALHEHPSAWSLYALAESMAAQSDRSGDLRLLIERAMRLYPGQPEILARAVNLAADTARVEAVDALLPRLRAVSEFGWHEARIGALCLAGDQSAVDAAHADARAAGLPPGGAEIVMAGYYYFFRAEGDGLERAERLIAPLDRKFANESGFQCLRLRLRLARGDEDGALTAHAALPAGLAGSVHLAPFAMLADARAGRDAAARRGWARHLARSGHIATNARSAHPREVAVKWHGGREDILLFSVMFNGIEFVDWFLDHYRRLGVDQFFIVDNGSTDGTFEKLRDQPDVSLFRQTGSFREAGCGVSWINHLLRRFGVGHWCFHVDMDEAFVFPKMDEGRSLRDFVGYVAAQGWASVPAMMLDVYPECLDGEPAGNPFEVSRYFDTDYHSFPNEFPPYRFIQGGVRARLAKRSLMMTKAPLVHATADLAFLANNHQHTHLPVAEVSGALLHYKFIGDLLGRVDEAIEREEHFMGARFYRALRDPIAGGGGPVRLVSRHSRELTGPHDLLDAGLMTSSREWDGWTGG